MARVTAPYGVQGWIKARVFTAVPDGLLAYPSWWLGTSDGQWREFAVRDARVHADSLVAHLEGLDRREAAAQWRGAVIGIPRALLPGLGEGEFYLRDLVGLAVVNRAGVMLGRVNGVMDTGAHPVLRVVAEGSRDEDEQLIPLVPVYIDSIDIAGGRIVVDWQSNY